MKSRMPQVIAVGLALLLAAFAGGYFLGRATVSPGSAVVVTEHRAPSREEALTAPGDAAGRALDEAEQMTEREETPVKEQEPAETQKTIVNINTASLEELQTLPGIGPKLAERIAAYRDENGPFTTVEELCEVSGIGEKILEDIRTQITVGG